MVLNTKEFTRYEESDMHIMLASIKDSLDKITKPKNPTKNDEFAISLKDSFSEIVGICDEILYPFCSGKAPGKRLYLITNSVSIASIIKFTSLYIPRERESRTSFYRELISFIHSQRTIDINRTYEKHIFREGSANSLIR